MNTSENVWRAYHATLRTFIKSRISDDATTDDILQTVFLKMHSGLASLKDATKLRSWFYRIVRNAITDYYRSQKLTVDVPESLTPPEGAAGEKVEQELSECLRPMIQKLPEDYRQALILSELKGYTQREVGRQLGISLSGAKSRVQRGRAMLKDMAECMAQLEQRSGD